MASRPWLQERKARTRQLIELGGLVAKAGLDQVTGSDRALLLGALLAIAERLKREPDGELSRRWRSRGQLAFEPHAQERTKS
jgi:hypothetical protein